MQLNYLKERTDHAQDNKLTSAYTQLGALLTELNKRDLPADFIKVVNPDIDELNTTDLSGNKLTRLVKQKQSKVLRQAEKQLKLVPQKYYTKLWMAAGMSTFGLPIGVAVGMMISNMGLLGIGLPFGFMIGLAVGARMDKKALKEGRQLPIEIK